MSMSAHVLALLNYCAVCGNLPAAWGGGQFRERAAYALDGGDRRGREGGRSWRLAIDEI